MTSSQFRITRRAVCASAIGAVPLVAGFSAATAQGRVPSLADDVNTYVGFGEHRAGTPTEGRTAAWIRERILALGYGVEYQKFPLRTLLQPGGQLSAGSARAALFPQWLPSAAALGRTLQAPLVPLEAEQSGPSIRIITRPVPATGNWSPAQDAWVAEAAAKGALGLVMAANEPTGELYAFNQHHVSPLPIPVGLVAARSLPELAAVAQGKNTLGQMVLQGDLVDTNSINVVGRKPGRGPTMVISTPLTGWFHCGGERGPGVAVLLRMAAMLAQTERPVLVLATGSHEIGHLGMAHALQHGAPTPAEVGFWFHFGASLATTGLDAQYRVTSPQFVVGTQVSEALLRPALAPFVAGYANGHSKTPGEAGQVLGAGHQRFAGMIGTFPGFHTPADRGEAIDYVKLEKIAEASAALLRRVATQEPQPTAPA
jgi:hypothetical protein